MVQTLLKRGADLLSVGVIVLLAAYGVFCLPYRFPPSEVTQSLAYLVGFNNRVGVMAAILAVGLLTLRAIFWSSDSPERVDGLFNVGHEKSQRRFPSMPVSILFFFIAVYLVVQIAVYLCVPSLTMWGETISCLPRLELGWRYHLPLYREIDWAYGPTLFYLPVVAIEIGWGFGVNPEVSYLVSLGLATIVGLWLLFYVVDSFRVKAWARVLIFSVAAICCCNDSLGVNYTLLRFMLPYAAILFVHRRLEKTDDVGDGRDALRPRPKTTNPDSRGRKIGKRRTVLESALKACGWCFVCALAVLSVSVEIGLAYVAAQLAYAMYRGWFGHRYWYWTILATAAAPVAIFLAFPGCFQSMAAFSKGGNAFPILPGPHIVFYLACLFWVVPIVLKACATRQPHAGTPLLLAWAVMAVMLVAPVLGRCDFGHVMFNGLGLFLLVFVVLCKNHPRWVSIYAASVVLLFSVLASVLSMIYASHDGGQLASVLATFGGSPKVLDIQPSLLVSGLELEKYEKIAVPFSIDFGTRKWLIETGRFLPQHHPDHVNVLSPADLERRLQGLSKADAVLVPEQTLAFRGMSESQFQDVKKKQIAMDEKWNAVTAGILLCCPTSFKTQQTPFLPRLEEARYIAAHFTPCRKYRGWVLFVK
ncbi:MAG: hypothetical protein ABFC77_05385 [Thermoguttaceae bacterium]